MKQVRLLLAVFVFTTVMVCDGGAQSIVQVFRLPSQGYWDQAWGLVADSTGLYMTSGTSTTTLYNYGFIYTMNFSGMPTDSLNPNQGYSQGIAYDGTNFYYVRRYTATCTIIKMTRTGTVIDSLRFSSPTRFIGGAAWDGSFLWVSDYGPTSGSTYLYKINWATKSIVDSIRTIGLQPQGITWDGQYLYYAMDLNGSEPNQSLIYVLDPVTRDTVRTIPMPEPANVDCNPRGLAWDGHYLWLVAEPVGASSGRSLYKYDLGGSGTPDIDVVTLVDFVGTRIGQSKTHTLAISNVGTAPLIIDSVRILLSNQITTTFVTPVTVPPGNGVSFPVTFTPAVFGSDSASIRIYSNDPDESPKIVAARGYGIYPTPTISVPSGFNFGARRVGASSSWTFTVQNQGGPQLSISSITTSSPTFSVDPVALPLNIDSLGAATLRVWFRPTASGSYLDTIKITSNASNGNVVGIVMQGVGDATQVPLGGVMWEGAVPDNPFTSFDDYQTKSIKQIGDVNGDGVNDVIVASGNYLVTCFNGNSSVTGDVLWVFNSGTNNNNTGSVDWEDALQIRDDINGDGVQDVVFGCAGGNEFVYTVSGRTGQIIWAYGDSINFSLGDIMGIRVDRDYNGDGVKDVLVSASGTSNFGGRHSVICLNGLNGQEIFNRQLPYNFTYDVVATRFGGAIGAANDGGPYAIMGFDTVGAPSWSYSLAGSLNAAWSLQEIPDINNDGLPDILALYGFSGGVVALTADAGIQLWATSLGGSNNGKIILLDDLNNNGFADFTLSAPQVVYRLDTYNGNVIWSAPLGSSYIRGITYLSDVNGDGIRDIAVATQQPGRIVVLNGTNGNILFSYEFGPSISQRGDRVATLASIDGNLSTEFVGGNREGRVICFSGGPNTQVGVNPPPSGLPMEFSVGQNYPNPFNPTTTLDVSLPTQGTIALKFFDILGREVRSLDYDQMPPGVHRIMWDGTNQLGSPVSSGVYFCQVRFGEKIAIRRMLLVK
jgi:hypothetical protein